MSLSHISFIRHDFHEVMNKEASVNFVENTIERLKKELCLGSCIIKPEVFDFDEYLEISFDLPIYNVNITMRNGFWEVMTGYRHCQLFYHQGDSFFLRTIVYDIAKALGQKEAWHMEENHSYDIGSYDLDKGELDLWINEVKKELKGEIPEFDVNYIMSQDDDYWITRHHDPVHHDSFNDCKARFNEIQEKIGDIKLLGMDKTGNFYRCEKDGHLILINSDTLSPFRLKKIDRILQGLNGSEFIIVKDGLSAVFSHGGRQLTRFVKGEFEWTFIDSNDRRGELDRIIYNKKAGIALFRD